MYAHLLIISVNMSCGVSGGTFKKLMFRSLGGRNFLLSGEKVMVKDLISSGSL